MKNNMFRGKRSMIFMLIAFFFMMASMPVTAQESAKSPEKKAVKTEKSEKAKQTASEERPYDVIDEEFRNIGPGFGGKNTIPFVVALVLFLLAMGGVVKGKSKAVKGISGLVALGAFGVIAYVVYWEARSLGRQQGYAPVQPIWFSHKVHATQNNIDCEYCHADARQSRHAGIPSLNVCLNCHSMVKEGKISGKKEIAKIYKHINDGKPVEWIKVHNLPDHVYFNHAQHVAVGKVECQECHGPVERMSRVVEYKELSMKFCLDCHREREIITDNQYYALYKFHLNPGEKPKVKNIGGQDCSSCHY
jgi:hypothetical protein